MPKVRFALFMLVMFFGLLTRQSPADDAGVPSPSPKDKCPVCGMFVAKFPDWIAIIAFTDGSRVYFDGPKDLFTYLLDEKKYTSGKNHGSIAKIKVKDYYGLHYIDAEKAYFVSGSDVFGPMGKEMVPFAKRVDAEEFLKDHQGKKIFSFPEVSRETLKLLE
jgi:copper chaperone NosL